MYYVPVSDWTMEKCGAKMVEIAGIDYKRQITAVFFNRGFLTSSTDISRKNKALFAESHENWDITYSPNHWSNEETMQSYIRKIIIPYVSKKEKS